MGELGRAHTASIRPQPRYEASRSDSCKAEEARPKKGKRGRFGHFSGEFGDYDLAVTGLEICHQDLVRAGIERAARAVTLRTAIAASAAAVPSTTTEAAAHQLAV
jgi:hypothetical protein